ncbi:MFS transporter [Gymnodinialimonas ceratoperidinii]|uniref:MFS transporter n=1 Tax=Gymnodinialimonas ceratoperidinii TaxID=2856823 RepID=A0A8F6TXX3_9RHOB|nr:MFS transporter [Gymnodinialimonas ceratoperidinii]QXT40947.1 MFS transporter [Gymnodinialimonas ceratoperidinii]
MRLLISFAALFLSVILLQFSSSGVGPLDVLSGTALGFTNGHIGLLGSAHFLGFFIGCWWSPRLMGAVGHSRAFAVFTAMGAIGLMAHMMILNPYAWAMMRVAIGLCIAGCFTVIEAWLQAKATNENRGRTMAIYRMVDTTGQLVAQFMIGVLAPASYVSYNLLAILCCAALLPLTMTRLKQPVSHGTSRLRPSLAWSLSPLAVSGVVVAGVSSASLRMTGPLYGQQVGLVAGDIGLFLAAFVLGGALAQWPAGLLADRYDRRWVLIGFSAASILACAVTIAVPGLGPVGIFGAALLFGATTFPIYSLSAAHAHDWADDSQRIELSAALMFFFATGAIVAPLATSGLITAYGPAALFYFISAAHAGLIVFGLIRVARRGASEVRKPYVWIPRTSFQVGRIFRRNSDK